jgi:hypothetical protein
MGETFSISADNLDELYDGTEKKDGSKSITQDGWTITVTNRGPKPSGKHVLYSMIVMVNGAQIGEPLEITLSVRRGENDKGNMRNNINHEMNKLRDNMMKSADKTDSSPTNLKL